MRENALLIEKSFADAIAMIAAAEELPEEKRRHWATSLRQVAKALDRPLEVIPARSRGGKPADTAFGRLMARAWKANVGAIAGWPDIKLVEPPVKSMVETAWSDFPGGLRRDVDSYLEGLTKIRRNRKGQRVRPLKP